VTEVQADPKVQAVYLGHAAVQDAELILAEPEA
jgi:hypothetical protein